MSSSIICTITTFGPQLYSHADCKPRRLRDSPCLTMSGHPKPSLGIVANPIHKPRR